MSASVFRLARLFCLPILFALTSQLSGMPLFEQGGSEWRLVLSENAAPSVEYAAEELLSALHKIGGLRLESVRSERTEGRNNIVVGDLSYQPIAALAEKLQLSPDDVEQIAVYTVDGNLYLAGNKARGALYAVYSFLQRQLGVCWAYEGEEGEFMPVLQSYDLPDLAYNHRPAIQYRGLHLCGRHVDPQYETWMTRNFINIMRSDPGQPKTLQERSRKGLHMMFSHHNIILPKELMSQYPECFALLDGKRHSRQICLSNDKAEELIVEKLHKWLEQHPEVEIMSVFPADNMDYCNCPDCTALDRSSVWFDFYKRVCTKLQPLHPKLKFASIAYQGYLEVPRTDLQFSEFIEYCQYDRCYMHRFDSDCNMNKVSLKRLEKWRNSGAKMGIYGYEFDVFAGSNSVYVPFYQVLAEEIKHFQNIGMKAVISEVSRSFKPAAENPRDLSRQNAFNIYLYAQMLWDADCDAELLLRNWSTRVYGEAADETIQIRHLLNARWQENTSHISRYHNSPFGSAERMLNPSLIEELNTLLAKGAGKLAADSPKRADYDYFRNCILQWQQSYWSAVQAGGTINLPKARNDKEPFANAIKLPPLQGKGKIPKTEIFLSWDDKYLNIKAICYEEQMSQLRCAQLERDGQVWMDDCIEIFLSNPGNSAGLYKHIVVNAKAVLYDSSAYNSSIFDLSWNPETLLQSEISTDHWQVQLRLPFSDLAPAPQAGQSWRGTFKRSMGYGRGEWSNSGYPNAVYHDANSFANIYFNANWQTDKRLLVLIPDLKSLAAAKTLQDTLLKDGWTSKFVAKREELPENLEDYDILLLRLPQRNEDKSLPFVELAKTFLAAGKTVLFSSYGGLPLEKYFADESLALHGSGWHLDKLRKTIAVHPGEWSRKPNNLAKQLETALCPPWGYKPTQPQAWTALASLHTAEGEEYPYLLSKNYLGGELLVTGADMGLAGGHVIFGSGRPDTVCMLLNNLLENRK